MKIRPMVAELFHADKRKNGQMDRRIDEANTLLFTILRTRLTIRQISLTCSWSIHTFEMKSLHSQNAVRGHVL